MDAPDETAAFRAHDQDCLVAASLSCPVCLSGSVDWHLSVTDDYESHVLGQEQALRLALHENRPLDPTPRPEPELVAL
jgi:hypothetical protein